MVSPIAVVGLAIFAAVMSASPPPLSTPWNDLRVTFSPNGPSGGFHQLPRTLVAAKAKGYVTPPEEVIGSNVKVLCPKNDPSVCVLYDKKGSVEGVQIGLKKSSIKKGYKFDKHPMLLLQSRFGHQVYVITLYTVNQNILKSGGRDSLAQFGTGNGLWLQNSRDATNLLEIPRAEKNMAQTQYVKQGCMNAMGDHYYYKMSKTLSCDDMSPIFPLFKNGQMIGVGVHMFGQPQAIGQTWFESYPAASVLPKIMPDAPPCMKDVNNPQYTLHIYFVTEPWNIKC